VQEFQQLTEAKLAERRAMRMGDMIDEIHDQLCPIELKIDLERGNGNAVEILNRYFAWIADVQKVAMTWGEATAIVFDEAEFVSALNGRGLVWAAEAWLASPDRATFASVVEVAVEVIELRRTV
jgi:hypothetical protein